MSTPINGFQFREHTNLGSSANSQGTLFGVSRPRTSAGPKGFSPARQDEVRQMLRPDPENEYAAPTSIFVGNLPGRPQINWNDRGSAVGGVQANKRLVQDMISRSSIPVHPEQRTKVNVLNEDEATSVLGTAEPGFTVNGNYIKPPTTHLPHTINIRGTAVHPYGPGRLGASPTLIHEFGHRDSYINKNESAIYRTPHQQGTEEAYADDFAFKHTKSFGGRKLEFLREYPSKGKDDGFGESYRSARTAPTKAPLATPSNIPEHQSLRQIPMLERIPATTDPKNPAVTWDYSHETGIPARTQMGKVAQSLISDHQFSPPMWR